MRIDPPEYDDCEEIDAKQVKILRATDDDIPHDFVCHTCALVHAFDTIAESLAMIAHKLDDEA